MRKYKTVRHALKKEDIANVTRCDIRGREFPRYCKLRVLLIFEVDITQLHVPIVQINIVLKND